MVVLARDADEYAAKGLTPEMVAAGAEQLSAEHGMPMTGAVRDRVPGTLPACTAVVAVRLRAPEQEAALLWRLRLRHFDGENLDEPQTIANAAQDVGLDPRALAGWMQEREALDAVEADATAARQPAPAALVLDHKLAGWERGRRYTCPSYEVANGGGAATQVVPGFQPWAAYDVVLANVLPEADRRPGAGSVDEVLAWAGEPLAAAEVAAVCGIARERAAEQLATSARRIPWANGELWELA